MITQLRIKNFKSLTDVRLNLTPMTVIVGNNASGKSSILQAADFLCSSAKEDFNIWLERRNLTVSDIKSNLDKSPYISFWCQMRLKTGDGEQHIYDWELKLHTNKEKNEITVQTEALSCDDQRLFLYTGTYANRSAKTPGMVELSGIELHSSYMRLLGKNAENWNLIQPVRSFLENSNSYELLSPADMRLSSRGEGNRIGLSGRNLPSFIRKMTVSQKDSFMKKLQDLLGDFITDVTTETSTKAGWTKIKTVEKYAQKTINVSSADISDGTLRLLAFLAISEIKAPECLMLLDEIENGINVNYAEKMIRLFQSIAEEEHHQLILTTHSTAFLDYVPMKDILYLYRDADGNSCAEHFDSSEQIRNLAKDLYPGEIILNLPSSEIVKRLLED